MALIWLLIACMIAMTLQGWLLGRRSLSKLGYTRRFSTEACHAGERIEMVETIANLKVLPVPWLRLEALLPASLTFARSRETAISKGSIYQNHASLFTLPPKTRITRTYQVECEGWGIYRIESVTMTGSDLFGVYTPARQIPLNQRLVVYPRLLEEEELPLSWRTWQGELAVRRWIVEDPFQWSGIREYAPGDPLNRIHWKASARSGGLQVRRNGHSADPRAMICLNIEESEAMWSVVTEPARLEAALSCAATVAARLIHQGMAAGYAHNACVSEAAGRPEGRVAPGHGLPHLVLLLEAMAGTDLKAREPFYEFLAREAAEEEREPLDYLLVTAHVSNRIADAIRSLEERGHRVTVVGEPLWGGGARDER
ncbi:DUF58 domain-containing protein [Paenibacillus spiritus]|uniref:DUF58 domain-containing protein n=1 Tax=Paenibacillus spiritus TaxID=2496557 RepID=A0A5J5G568_9BACL|nr:DUF58 domain-containing protein [Paenibacillus spiritus]KAA9002398.1 DUF58 domain-containing protein [Paenibacillus spiritus]